MSKDLTSDLTEYIKRNIKKGYTKESLVIALRDQGYSRIQIKKAIERADTELSKTAPKLSESPKIKREAYPDHMPYHEQIFKEHNKKSIMDKFFS